MWLRFAFHTAMIVIFREQYSGIFWEHPWMYKRLQEILSDDWDVLIVAGYRPYFEWLKSFWFQGTMKAQWGTCSIVENLSQNSIA